MIRESHAPATSSRSGHQPGHARVGRSLDARGTHRGTETRAMTQGAASTTPGNLSEDQVRLRLQGLQHEVERSATLARWLGWLAILLVALLIVLIVSIYLYYVMQYASVSSVEATRHRRATRSRRDCLLAAVLGQDRVRPRKRGARSDLDRIREGPGRGQSHRVSSPGRGRKRNSRPST